ncbi:hypothetical protein [Spirosoma spitsbergense]|uniref:hypothetical protein n=1 Tax=Spirosoma spitsbergense TaxID=431554 RepID=UPI00037FE279|nr:hypothetical protein [Spirosoma spitsbergense]
MRHLLLKNLIRFATLPIGLICLTIYLPGCSAGNSSSSGTTKKMSISVGDIREISLPGSGDGSMELIGTSDNQEIVDVSRRELAPAVDTLKRMDTGSTVFQIKGITAGKANVVFRKQAMGATGNGQPVRTYIVQVKAK